MNSNSLFQQIQLLDNHIANYNFNLQRQQENSDQFNLDDLLERINTIFVTEKSLLYEFERQISSKIDRIEFSSIVQQKANQADVQKILFEILNCNNLNASQKLQNYLGDSIPQEDSCENDYPKQPKVINRNQTCSLENTI